MKTLRHCSIQVGFALALLIAYSLVQRVEAGSFTATGSLSFPRVGHTATLLANGKVLVAGGGGGTEGIGIQHTAELYNPVTGTFSLTGNMSVNRAIHTSTLLKDGRVLLVGGAGDLGGLANCDVYDPTTGTFSPAASMSFPRFYHATAILPDGRVLVTGGVDNVVVNNGSAEVYDPQTGVFTPTATMSIDRYLHTATLLNNGLVLIVGGNSTSSGVGVRLASAELYDPATGTFSPTGSMHTPRYIHTATLLADGKVLVACGSADGSSILSSAELYDPVTGTFSLTGSLAVGRLSDSTTLLTNGQVLVVGGTADTGWISATELFEPSTGTFSPSGSTTTGRANHTATLLPSGKVLIAAGYDSTGIETRSAELYDLAGVSGGPITLIQNLVLLVANLNLANGIENSLDAKLDNALQVLQDVNSSNDGAACSSLDAFIAETTAQSGKKITVSDANILITSAKAIKVALNCGK